jgi:flagellar biosynthesis/type III secretory pathway ATPase
MMTRGMPLDELEKISDAADMWQISVGNRITDAIGDAVSREIDDVRDIVSEIDSHSTLDDHINTLQKLAKRTAIPSQNVERAVRRVMERIAELKEQTSSQNHRLSTLPFLLKQTHLTMRL